MTLILPRQTRSDLLPPVREETFPFQEIGGRLPARPAGLPAGEALQEAVQGTVRDLTGPFLVP